MNWGRLASLSRHVRAATGDLKQDKERTDSDGGLMNSDLLSRVKIEEKRDQHADL